ncbi:MAG: FeGP cofactor biosynthesis protein HcgF family protein [Methanobrevibacter sp.]|jgi:uncharacterized protein (UPF0254 family)|nr:FeGP cofactor biosynthesis protein HcgF family protein [Candidatus Methanovirga australis]
MIKIATAECFTHGHIGREIHNFIQSYKGNLVSKYLGDITKDYFKDIVENKYAEGIERKYSKDKCMENRNLDELQNLDDLRKNLILVSSLFIPSVDGLIKILNLNPPEPQEVINGVKIYGEEEDKFVSSLMANGVRELLNVDIGIGTTAGFGRGGITISNSKLDIITTADVYADLRILTDISLNDSELIFKRQENGIVKTLELLLHLLNNDLDGIAEFDNIEITEKNI